MVNVEIYEKKSKRKEKINLEICDGPFKSITTNCTDSKRDIIRFEYQSSNFYEAVVIGGRSIAFRCRREQYYLPYSCLSAIAYKSDQMNTCSV